MTLTIEDSPTDNRPVLLIGAVVAFIVTLTAGAVVLQRRKTRLAELDLIESWDAFGSVKEVVKLEDSAPLEGGAVDGASEVEAEQDGTAEEPKPLTGADLDWDNV